MNKYQQLMAALEEADSTYVLPLGVEDAYRAYQKHVKECGEPVVMTQHNDAYDVPAEVGIREIPLMRKCKDYESHLVTGGP